MACPQLVASLMDNNYFLTESSCRYYCHHSSNHGEISSCHRISLLASEQELVVVVAVDEVLDVVDAAILSSRRCRSL